MAYGATAVSVGALASGVLNATTLLTACKVKMYGVPLVNPIMVAPVVVGANFAVPPAPPVHVNNKLATLFLFRALLAQFIVMYPAAASGVPLNATGGNVCELVKPDVAATVVPLNVVAVTAKA